MDKLETSFSLFQFSENKFPTLFLLLYIVISPSQKYLCPFAVLFNPFFKAKGSHLPPSPILVGIRRPSYLCVPGNQLPICAKIGTEIVRQVVSAANEFFILLNLGKKLSVDIFTILLSRLPEPCFFTSDKKPLFSL